MQGDRQLVMSIAGLSGRAVKPTTHSCEVRFASGTRFERRLHSNVGYQDESRKESLWPGARIARRRQELPLKCEPAQLKFA